MLSNSTANNESVTDLKALFIYCCNYWQVLRSRPRRHQRESDSELQQSTLLSLDN
ncbi:uncharacterized protein LOC111074041 isoform X2 [Drosophila obscura]|uniref:uncharacterized protein LOC111074041 isoform X2 n=1 Tax=Drosophila obscura TaxID=7282 RepID=UPI001BB25DA3|nr:uncharacterized protein LOC111074041 isoform X2 [Drosophila obscura]